jgi:hypothetical protein
MRSGPRRRAAGVALPQRCRALRVSRLEKSLARDERRFGPHRVGARGSRLQTQTPACAGIPQWRASAWIRGTALLRASDGPDALLRASAKRARTQAWTSADAARVVRSADGFHVGKGAFLVQARILIGGCACTRAEEPSAADEEDTQMVTRIANSLRRIVLALGTAVAFIVLPVSTSSLPGGLALLPIGASEAEALTYVRVRGPRRLPPHPSRPGFYVSFPRTPWPLHPSRPGFYVGYPRGVSAGVVRHPVARAHTGTYRNPRQGPYHSNRHLSGPVRASF